MVKYWYCYGSNDVAINKENLYRFEKLGVDVSTIMECVEEINSHEFLFAYADNAHIGGVYALPVDNPECTNIIADGEHVASALIDARKGKKTIEKNAVNHPSHYTSHPSGVECIQITEHYNFCIGNAIKYLWRNGLKGEQGKTDKQKQIEDLEKAIWYINREIENLKK